MNQGFVPIMRSIVILTVLLWTASASAAYATSCREWNRLDAGQRAWTVDDMIQRAIDGSGGRSYRVNRNAIARCLASQSRAIEYAFDDVCSDSRTAGIGALDGTFKHYIWSCVR